MEKSDTIVITDSLLQIAVNNKHKAHIQHVYKKFEGLFHQNCL